MKIRTSSLFSRAIRWAATIAGAGFAVTAPSVAQSVSPAQAPAEWVVYAHAATSSITGWLQAESKAAVRLRTYLDTTRPAPDQATAPLVIKVWVEADGTITRIDHPPFSNAEANVDLRNLIVGQRLPGTPPPDDMLLPLRIAVQLDAPESFSEPVGGRDPRKLM